MSKTFSRIVAAFFRYHRVVSIVVQLAAVVLSNWLAFVLRFDGAPPGWAYAAFWRMLPWLIVIRGATFIPFRLYQGLWRYTSIYDLQALVGGVAASSFAFFVLAQTPIGPAVYPRSIFIIDAIVLTLLLGALRLTGRIRAELTHGARGKRVLIFGAGDAGELIVRDMKNDAGTHYQPIGFIDDDRSKIGRRIHGVPVLGTRLELPRIIARYHPHEVLIALPHAGPEVVRSIIHALEPFKTPIKTLPNMLDIIDGKVEVGQIRSLAVEDLLTRAPVGLDPAPVKYLIKGHRVMVTGAGGSIGSELCRQIARLHPASLVLFDRYENSLHAIRTELDDSKLSFGLHPVVGDVTDPIRVNEVLERLEPEIIFHAAAHKHVPLMEENPCEAIKNNVRGTRLLAQAADRHGVDRFILISTDKAVNPTSVMGASKRLAEMVLQRQAIGSGTSYSVVRFGNVLASNGSVVPRFLEQIKNGGPVTVTHPDMRRFFMLIPEAVQLVLHAAAQAQSGAIYVLEMGNQIKVVDMARDLIRLSGRAPDEIAIEFTGLRPGEKLFEELVGIGEDVRPSAIDRILCVTNRARPEPTLWSAIELLENQAIDGAAEAVLVAMRALIPEYSSAGADHEPSVVLTAETTVQAAAACPILSEQPCPHCAGTLHRSRTRTLRDRIRKNLTMQRPFRCEDCLWRGWLLPLDFSDYGRRVDSVPPPDLASLDALPGQFAEPSRPSFSPRNLA